MEGKRTTNGCVRGEGKGKNVLETRRLRQVVHSFVANRGRVDDRWRPLETATALGCSWGASPTF